MQPHESTNASRLRGPVLIVFVLSAALARLLPHPPNFTPVGAMALFAGAHFASRVGAIVVPLAAMLLSDLALGAIYGWSLGPMTLVIYSCIAATTLLGMTMRGRHPSRALPVSSFAASLLFFVVTNAAVWLGSATYASDASGFIACYVAALPFFGYTLAGHVVFGLALFGAFEYLQRRVPSVARAGVGSRA